MGVNRDVASHEGMVDQFRRHGSQGCHVLSLDDVNNVIVPEVCPGRDGQVRSHRDETPRGFVKTTWQTRLPHVVSVVFSWLHTHTVSLD